jgi:hypothetical protein
MIILDGEALNVRGQRLEEFPESPGGDGFHFDGGHSRRRPFADSRFSFVKKEIELAGSRVGIHLLVPSPLFAELKPLDDTPVFFRGQSLYSRFDLLNPTHA